MFFKYSVPLLVLLAGGILVLTALPRVRASLNYLSVSSSIEQLNQDKQLKSEKVKSLIVDSRQSLELHEEARYFADLSSLLAYQARNTRILSLSSRQVLLKEAQTAIKRSLKRSPVGSFHWFQLAKLDFLLGSAASKRTVQALSLSILTGPYELGLLLPRLELYLSLFSKLDDQDKLLLRSQILIAWQKSPQKFIKNIASKQTKWDKIRLVLADSPDVLAGIKAEIEKTYQ